MILIILYFPQKTTDLYQNGQTLLKISKEYMAPAKVSSSNNNSTSYRALTVSPVKCREDN